MYILYYLTTVKATLAYMQVLSCIQVLHYTILSIILYYMTTRYNNTPGRCRVRINMHRTTKIILLNYLRVMYCTVEHHLDRQQRKVLTRDDGRQAKLY